MKKVKKWPSLVAAMVLVGALGCAEEPEVDTSTAAMDTNAMETSAVDEVPGLPDGSEPVQVTLTSFGIEMPGTLPAGRTVLTVSNESDTEHNLEIEGQGLEKSFEENLQGGEVKTMEVDLVAGEYRVYCPVGDHASQGMETTLTVTGGSGTMDGDMADTETGGDSMAPAESE